MDDCVVARNVSLGDTGGGMWVSTTNAIIRGTAFENNRGGAWAGAVQLEGGFLVENCLFRGNKTKGSGTIVNRPPAGPPGVFRNCLVGDNEASSYAGFYFWGSSNHIENCTATPSVANRCMLNVMRGVFAYALSRTDYVGIHGYRMLMICIVPTI